MLAPHNRQQFITLIEPGVTYQVIPSITKFYQDSPWLTVVDLLPYSEYIFHYSVVLFWMFLCLLNIKMGGVIGSNIKQDTSSLIEELLELKLKQAKFGRDITVKSSNFPIRFIVLIKTAIKHL